MTDAKRSPAAIQLAVDTPAHASLKNPPYDYQNSRIYIDIPSGVSKVILAGSSCGKKDTVADDKIKIQDKTHDNIDKILFEHDYSTKGPGITPLPPHDVTNKFITNGKPYSGYVNVVLTDLHRNSFGCGEFWLVFAYAS